MISEESLDRFRAIYREETGREISVADAREQAKKLIRFLVIAQRLPNNFPSAESEEKKVKNQIILKLERQRNWHRG